MVCCDSISHAEQISRISPRPTWTRSLYGSINVHGRPWDSKLLPIDYEWCCSDQLNPPPESGQIADVSVSPVCANRVITQRGQQHPIRSPRRRGEQRATWNGSPASRWNGTCERWSDANRSSAGFRGVAESEPSHQS